MKRWKGHSHAQATVSFLSCRVEAPGCAGHWPGAEPEGLGGPDPELMD